MMKNMYKQTKKSFLFLLLCQVMILKCGADMTPKCFQEGDSPSVCECLKGTTRSGEKITIKCNLEDKEAVTLTDALYPFESHKIVQVYVQVRNALAVKVTQSFLQSLLASPSVVLDFWRGGILTLESTPPSQNKLNPAYKTTLRVGIINCTVPSFPENFFRDRREAGLFIRGSRVGTISQNVLFNVAKVKYLKIEDSSVESVESPLSQFGSLTLAKKSDDKWQGFDISNSSINDVAQSAFTITHEDTYVVGEECDAVVRNSRIGEMKSGALNITGKVNVRIIANTFKQLVDDAIKVNVTGYLKFEENVIKAMQPNSLKGIICGPISSMEKNSIHMTTPHDQPYNSSTIPFHESCKNPQVFIVKSPALPRTMKVTSSATWILLIILLVILIVVGGLGFYAYRNKTFRREYRRGEVTRGLGFSGRTTLQELRNSNDDEDDDVEETELETGVSNPVYDIKEPS